MTTTNYTSPRVRKDRLIPAAAAALLAASAGAALQPSSDPPIPPKDAENPNDMFLDPDRATPGELEQIDDARDPVRERDLTIEGLRRENERLRQWIARLEQQIAAMGGTTPEGGPSARSQSGGESGAEIPSDPMASPASLKNAMTGAYDEAFPRESRPVVGESRRAYQADVRRWTRSVGREMRGRFEWLARLEPVPAPAEDRPGMRRDRRVIVSVLDPASMKVIGEPEIIDLPTRFEDRVLSAEPDQLWRMSGQLEAAPAFDGVRSESGPFDYPALIGPYATFGYDLRWNNLAETTEEQAKSGVVDENRSEPVDR